MNNTSSSVQNNQDDSLGQEYVNESVMTTNKYSSSSVQISRGYSQSSDIHISDLDVSTVQSFRSYSRTSNTKYRNDTFIDYDSPVRSNSIQQYRRAESIQSNESAEQSTQNDQTYLETPFKNSKDFPIEFFDQILPCNISVEKLMQLQRQIVDTSCS